MKNTPKLARTITCLIAFFSLFTINSAAQNVTQTGIDECDDAQSESLSRLYNSARNVGTMRCADKVFSLPGQPFMHKLLANEGESVVSVDNLPNGLELKNDRPKYKYIYGIAPEAGEYTYTVNLDNGTTVDVGFTVSPDLPQPTPFMGVLTWNAFQGNINDFNIKAIADAFETFGLKELGYNYMCIDDEWAAPERTDGHLTWGTKFADHTDLVNYVHSKGLKIGIYSDAGSATCSNAQPGSYGYETTDAQDFLNWDFDLLKYDFCNATGGTSPAEAERAYTAMGNALKQASNNLKQTTNSLKPNSNSLKPNSNSLKQASKNRSKNFILYMCEWGDREPWKWAANTGATCWRSTADSRDYWSDTTYKGGVIQILDVMKNIWAYQGVNRWNDADMLVVGLHGTGYSSNDGGDPNALPLAPTLDTFIQEKNDNVQEKTDKAQKETDKAQKETDKAQKETDKAQKETDKAQKETDKAQKLVTQDPNVNCGLTIDEARTNFALWCMFASPLTLSNNITNLDGKPNTLTGKNVTNIHWKEDLEIIRNKELIAIDQDPLGQAGEPIYDTPDYIVFQKDLVDGSIALSVTNLSNKTKDIPILFSDLSALKKDQGYKIRNLWTHTYINESTNTTTHKTYNTSDTFIVSVHPHATAIYRIQPFDDADIIW